MLALRKHTLMEKKPRLQRQLKAGRNRHAKQAAMPITQMHFSACFARKASRNGLSENPQKNGLRN